MADNFQRKCGIFLIWEVPSGTTLHQHEFLRVCIITIAVTGLPRRLKATMVFAGTHGHRSVQCYDPASCERHETKSPTRFPCRGLEPFG